MRWLGRLVRADDGVDPARGIEAEQMVWSRLSDGGYRLTLRDVAGKVIASLDLDRADVRDTREALTQVLRVP